MDMTIRTLFSNIPQSNLRQGCELSTLLVETFEAKYGVIEDFEEILEMTDGADKAEALLTIQSKYDDHRVRLALCLVGSWAIMSYMTGENKWFLDHNSTNTATLTWHIKDLCSNGDER